MIQRTIWFSGRVQGVGFRYTACQVADEFAITGYVRNLPDGRVEAVVEGEQAEVERFLAALDRQMAGNIRERQYQDGDATGRFHGFGVRYS